MYKNKERLFRENHPEEWKELYEEARESWYEEHDGDSDESVLFFSPSGNKNEQTFTWGRIKKSFEDEDELCEKLVYMEKLLKKYKNEQRKQNDY